MNYKTTACKGCGMPVVWATNIDSGKRVPIDIDLLGAAEIASVTGHIYIVRGEPGNPRAIALKGGLARLAFDALRDGRLDTSDELVGISHFKTCPKAGEF